MAPVQAHESAAIRCIDCATYGPPCDGPCDACGYCDARTPHDERQRFNRHHAARSGALPPPGGCTVPASALAAMGASAVVVVFIFPALRWLCVQADALRTWIVQ